MLNRRQLFKASAATGAALALPAAWTLRQSAFAGAVSLSGNVSAGAVPGGTLDPLRVPKYVTPLFILPAMPQSGSSSGIDSYQIAARQLTQQILPTGLPATTVFAYGSPNNSSTFHYPGYTIEARTGRPVRVTWANQLVTPSGDFRPHLFPVDQTLHWANPPGGLSGRDSRPDFTSTPGPYRGPVPMVTHLHGAHSFEESDGYPEAWYLPVARNIPSSYAKVGSFYDRFKAEAHARNGVNWSRVPRSTSTSTTSGTPASGTTVTTSA